MIRLFPAIEPRPQKTLKGTGIKKKPEIESHYIYMQSVWDNANGNAIILWSQRNEVSCRRPGRVGVIPAIPCPVVAALMLSSPVLSCPCSRFDTNPIHSVTCRVTPIASRTAPPRLKPSGAFIEQQLEQFTDSCESERCLALRCSLLGRLNAHAVITDCIRQPPALATFAPSPAASEVVSEGVSKGVSKGVAPPVWRQRRPRSKSCDELKQKLALARCSLFGRLNAQADLSVLTAAIRPPPAAAAVCSAPPPSAADVAMADVVKEVAVSLGGCDSPVRTRPRVEVPWAPIAKSRHISRTISRTIRPRCKFGKLGLNLDKPVQHELFKKRLAEHGAHSNLESASPVSLRIGA